MKFLVALVVVGFLLAVATSRRVGGPKAHQLTADYSFEQYLNDFHKAYTNPMEHARRAKTFAKALKEVLEHNAKPHVSYKKGVNHLSDWDEVELRRLRGGRFSPKVQSPSASTYQRKVSKIATSLDWRQKFPPVVTAVKDQGQCGDCWAHAVTEAIESSYAIATGQLFVLSHMQVTSCTPAYGSCFACGGSYPTLAYEYAAINGITEEWIYPFESYNGTSINCSATPYISTPINTIVNISGFTNVGPNSQDDFVSALNELGPMSILVDASSWSSYESGIFDGCDYSQNISMDHAVQVVGYGTEKGRDYWIVRNSWAPSWGEIGFIRLAKPATPQCGWNVGAAVPDDCTGNGPSAVWTCGECGILYGGQFPTASPSGSSSSASQPSSSGSQPSSSGSVPSSSGSVPSSSGSVPSSSGSVPSSSGSVPSSSGSQPSSSGSGSSMTFVQELCSNSVCSVGCQNVSLPTGQCLQVTGGGSAIVTCTTTALVEKIFTTADCTGTSQSGSMPLNECLQSSSGGYLENFCLPGLSSGHKAGNKLRLA